MISKEYIEEPMELVYYGYGKVVNGITLETTMNCSKPNRDRKYIKILAMCLAYAPAKVIYPNTKFPLMQQVRDLCRLGYLARYRKVGERQYYYKTTQKGINLLIDALKK